MEILDLDIIMKNTKQMPYVKFPHSTHTEWLSCTNCHEDIFAMKAGSHSINMNKILEGQYCGECHGRVAFSPLDSCHSCHSVPHPNSPERWW